MLDLVEFKNAKAFAESDVGRAAAASRRVCKEHWLLIRRLYLRMSRREIWIRIRIKGDGIDAEGGKGAEKGSALVMVTHGNHLASYADPVFHIIDGRL